MAAKAKKPAVELSPRADRAKRALKLVNRLRKEAGMGSTSRFKRGVPSHPRSCCVAMSLQGTGIKAVTSHGVYTRVTDSPCFRSWVDLFGAEAGTIKQFILDFDKGHYPQYEIPKSTVKVAGEIVTGGQNG